MGIEPIRIHFDRGHPGVVMAGNNEVVHWPVIHQGTQQSLKMQMKIDDVFHDFTIYDEIVMTVREQVQSAAPLFTLLKSAGGFTAGVDSLTFNFGEATTKDIPLPEKLKPTAEPQMSTFGHDVRLIAGGVPIPFATGVLSMVWAFTR